MTPALMPPRLDLGQYMQSTMGSPIHHWKTPENRPPNTLGLREVMGYFLPDWQRGLVWSDAQKVGLIESAWRGLNIGTYTFNRTAEHGQPLDNLLIDGQQRLWAVQCYLSDEFSVYGYLWSELPACDKRRFLLSTHFSCYITRSEDEGFLRDYYNMTNFGGTAHSEGDRA